jgi:hypothetical protein
MANGNEEDEYETRVTHDLIGVAYFICIRKGHSPTAGRLRWLRRLNDPKMRTTAGALW